MKQKEFDKAVLNLMKEHDLLIQKKNKKQKTSNGIVERYKYPVLTAEHAPVFWRYDLNYKSNPHLLERLAINCTFNSGAMMFKGKYTLVVRVEGTDRKSFFAIAQSHNGIDNWQFWDYPINLPQNAIPDTNVYDMRLTEHEDGWIYGLFCTERKDPNAPEGDTSSAIAECGIARTKDLVKWHRLPDLKTSGGQQRNCVLHPEFIDGKYAIYTRPQDGFIDIGRGGGIGFGLTESMEKPVIENEIVIENKIYHTIKETKNGLGPGPIKTKKGWLHLAHGVRNTAAGLRYVLYMFLTDLKQPEKVIRVPGGYFMAPQGEERVGDVSNVLFSNGWIVNRRDEVFIYYGSSDTRMHVAISTIDKLLDYVLHTAEDGFRSAASVKQRSSLIKKNLAILKKKKK
jgi:4-O-beta-D-mannosyl-D-glucose phosphorylase